MSCSAGGPSKQVLLIRWDMAYDRFEYGQWFNGHIYERRCDLSPSGEKLIYFAAKFKGPLYSWTAISKPPYLTALALWPKGDTWNGGGLFTSERVIMLNHGPIAEPPAQGHIPPNVAVKPLGLPRGEDDPLYNRRLLRDGWMLRREGWTQTQKSGKSIWVSDPPRVYVRHARIQSRDLGLEMRLAIGHRPGGPWYEIDHRVTDGENVVLDLGRTDWADWDRRGDLLFAREGRLYRLKGGRLASSTPCTLEDAVPLADFRDLRFEEKPPPDHALRW